MSICHRHPTHPAFVYSDEGCPWCAEVSALRDEMAETYAMRYRAGREDGEEASNGTALRQREI
jgi:hypothetical protein